jgi:hypothetical protein
MLLDIPQATSKRNAELENITERVFPIFIHYIGSSITDLQVIALQGLGQLVIRTPSLLQGPDATDIINRTLSITASTPLKLQMMNNITEYFAEQERRNKLQSKMNAADKKSALTSNYENSE